MELSKRLSALGDLIDQDVIADIGCDHGYLCIYALVHHKAEKAYACDVAEGPLQSAQANIEEAGLTDKIICRLQNGLQDLPADVRQIIVAGMGAQTIIEILQAGKARALQLNSLLLSPHKDAMELRRWLADNGFAIVKEQMVHDGHFYPILLVRPAANGLSLTEAEQLYGKNVQIDPAYLEFLDFEQTKTKKILQQMPADKAGPMKQRLELLEERICKAAAGGVLEAEEVK